jgi:membrane fusion protein (multidrug efflux system)
MRVIITALIALSLTACGKSKKKIEAPAGQKQQAMRVDAYIVTPQPFAENIEVPGTIVANEVTEVHPEVSGRITYLNVAEGKYVSKGTLLAKLYDGDLQAQLKKVQVQLSIAQKTEERQMQLLKIQGISQQDYDLSLLQVNNLRADIDIIRTSIGKTQIRAPFNGKLGLKNISPGAYVTPATVIAVINQTSQLKLDFTVPEKYTGQIKTGQLVSFTNEGSDKKYSAKVIATESNITETTRSLMVRSAIIDNDASLIPTQAVLPQARGKKVVIFNNGAAKFIDVTTGNRDSARIQITEGLKKGDTVVVTGLLSVRPDARIQVGKIINKSPQ